MKTYGGSGCIDQFHAPATLPQGIEHPVPIGQEAEWAPKPAWTIWRSENILTHRHSNPDPSIVQPLASRYTDCATVNTSNLK
jgi:hypothetical protein